MLFSPEVKIKESVRKNIQMNYSEHSTSLIKQRVPLLPYLQRFLQLRRSGARWVALCPFHQEKSPSFTVNEEENLFYCFGCQASGDIFTFYQRYYGVDFLDALIALAEEARVELHTTERHAVRNTEKQTIHAIYSLAEKEYRTMLHTPMGQSAKQYLLKRGFTEESLHTFNIGYAPNAWDFLETSLLKAGFSQEMRLLSKLVQQKSNKNFDTFRNRIMFPITTISGIPIAFGGRVLPCNDNAAAPKYINSSETVIYTKGEHLYALAQARQHIQSSRTILLTEGYVDAIMLHQYGFTNACAILGTALTPAQIRKILSLDATVQLILDGDEAGQKATLRSAVMLLQAGLAVSVISLPPQEDIDSFLRTSGKDAFVALQEKAVEGLTFCTNVIRKQSPRAIAQWIAQFIDGIEDPIVSDLYKQKLSQHFALSHKSLSSSNTTPSTQHARTPLLENLASDTESLIVKHLLSFPEHVPHIRNAGVDSAVHNALIQEILSHIYAGETHEVMLKTMSAEACTLLSKILVLHSPPKDKNQELQDIIAYLDRIVTQRNVTSMMQLMHTSQDIYSLATLNTYLQRRKHG